MTDYAGLVADIEAFAAGIAGLRLSRHDRVAIYLPKQPESVIAMFGSSRAGCVFVPVNPLLKPAQVGHILRDCGVRVLLSSPERIATLSPEIALCPEIRHLIVTGSATADELPANVDVRTWDETLAGGDLSRCHRSIDIDMASIFYTSGSTGKPKGVVLSHRNMVAGAMSVAEYLGNVPSDRLLTALPFSFDYGFSQLSTAFHAGASVALMDYLLPRDVISQVARDSVTGLAGVPPLWRQLADLEWPQPARDALRYFTNSGGAMPRATLEKLRRSLPNTRPYLMYGLTEAFRSTYLPPEEIDRRPDSIGKAIPNAEVLVVRPDGTPCAANESGELVHRGALVSLGYWNDPVKTAERFRPVPNHDPALVLGETAVWSGDTVRMDEDGFIYFIGRLDEMIKTSGFRVSPTEIEEVVFASGLVADVVAVGLPHPQLGQAIVVIATAAPDKSPDSKQLLDLCRIECPRFMVPLHVEWRDSLPRNPNGKYDRTKLVAELGDLFAAIEST
jgi:acyl-CoA ligase (AMP-forming) (exosortase A-associated)